MCFDFFDPISILNFGNGICEQVPAWSKVSHDCAIGQAKNRVFSKIHLFFLKDVTQLCSHNEKVEQKACNMLFCRFYPLMHFNEGTGKCMNCGKNLSTAVASNISPGFFLKCRQLAQFGNLVFHRHQLLLLSEFCKMIFSVVWRWQRCGLGDDFNFQWRQRWKRFFCAIKEHFLPIFKLESVVYWLEASYRATFPEVQCYPCFSPMLPH